MPREFDTSSISFSRRVFIKTSEWDHDETREYWFTGFEKADRVSKNTGNQYQVYLVYLVPADDLLSPELTLQIFTSQAGSLKEASPKPFQRVSVTKSLGEKGEEWVFSAKQEFLPEKQRPATADYPALEDRPAAKPEARQGEIDISEIPF